MWNVKVMNLKWVGWMLAFLWASTSHAAKTDEQINTLLEASGVEEMVNEFPQMVKLGVLDAFKQEPDAAQADAEAIVSAMDKALVPDKMLQEIRQALSASLSQQQIADLLVWYQSPLGKAFTEAESKSGTDEAFEAMSDEAPALMKRERLIGQVQKIEKQLDLTAMTVDFFEKVQLAVFAGIMSALEPESAVDLSELKSELAAVRASAESSVEQMMVVSMAYAYKDFTPEEVDKYSAFLATPAATTFNQVATQSMFASIQRGFQQWAQEMGGAMDDI